MPGKHLFEYAVIRVMPRVEREEFLNVGTVLYCAATKFLEARYVIKESRIRAFCDEIDIDELKEYLESFEKICKGGQVAGKIGALTVAERFRWLTATRSTIVQTSKVHPGLCGDPLEMLEKLHGQLVL